MCVRIIINAHFIAPHKLCCPLLFDLHDCHSCPGAPLSLESALSKLALLLPIAANTTTRARAHCSPHRNPQQSVHTHTRDILSPSKRKAMWREKLAPRAQAQRAGWLPAGGASIAYIYMRVCARPRAVGSAREREPVLMPPLCAGGRVCLANDRPKFPPSVQPRRGVDLASLRTSYREPRFSKTRHATCPLVFAPIFIYSRKGQLANELTFSVSIVVKSLARKADKAVIGHTRSRLVQYPTVV